MTREFVTALNCIDGRVQEPVIDYLRENFQTEYVDDVTFPGMDKVVSEDLEIVEEIRGSVEISVNEHKSNLIAVVGHNDCVANPGSRAHHISQVREAIEVVKAWDMGVNVIGLYVNEDWEVERID